MTIDKYIENGICEDCDQDPAFCFNQGYCGYDGPLCEGWNSNEDCVGCELDCPNAVKEVEMKLTDEDIVMSLCAERQHLLNEQRLTGRAPDEQIVYVTGGAVFEILDLIHRLQNEIAGYKANQEIWISGYQGLQAENENLKAEIERLTEKRDKLFNANVDTQEELNKVRLDRNRENTELQKQINELIEKSLLKCEYCPARRDLGLLLYQNEQAVKDTAKEILQEGRRGLSSSLRKWIIERFGLEGNDDN